MKIPFTKAHGARNDFLLTWRDRLPPELSHCGAPDFAAAAVAICDRHTGAGADGWLLVSKSGTGDAAIELWNSDGSQSEMSGNGTRCIAALLIEAGCAGEQVSIATGAGLKRLRLLERRGLTFVFEMNMGRAVIEELHATAEKRDAVILNVGNPQCAVLVEHFNFDWQAMGARLASHPRFPHGANVSFVRVIDRHTIEVRFFERGAGATMSSGTGSTGAAAAAGARGLVETPVRVLTPAGPLELRWDGEDILLSGPAEIVATGEFYWEGKQS
jgi:diaminopimelate epimerase